MSKKISIVLICIDYRFWSKALYLLKKKYGSFDIMTLAGASKNIVSPFSPVAFKTLLENIAISIKLHNAWQIILSNHTDCGAYGESKKFKSKKDEVIFHQKELQKAKKIIQKKFPKLKIKTVIIKKKEKR